MSRTSVNDGFEDFYRDVARPGASTLHRQDARTAFFAGAMFLLGTLSRLMRAAKKGDMVAVALRRVLTYERELRGFFRLSPSPDDVSPAEELSNIQVEMAKGVAAGELPEELRAQGITPPDAIRWVLWRRLREPGFAPKFPFTLDELAAIDPASVQAIDRVFLADEAFYRRYPEELRP